MIHHVEQRPTLSIGQGPVFADTLVDILNVDNGIVDKRADGNGNTAKAHGVDGEPEEMEHQHGHDYRQRQSYDRHHGCAHVHQEYEQHYDNEQRAHKQRLLKI